MIWNLWCFLECGSLTLPPTGASGEPSDWAGARVDFPVSVQREGSVGSIPSDRPGLWSSPCSGEDQASDSGQRVGGRLF